VSVRDLGSLTVDDFAPCCTSTHGRPRGSAPFELELVEVTEIPREPGGRTPVALVFQGGPSPPLPQRI
jgi:hypothetical protein